MRELASIRKDINSVDSAIRELFLLRMSLAHEVAETKAQSDDKIYKPDREAEIIEQRSAGMEEEVRLKYIALLQSMIRASREYQYSEILRLNPEKFPFHPSSEMLKPKTVFYQGVPGAYQELAAARSSPSAIRSTSRPGRRSSSRCATAKRMSASFRSKIRPPVRSARSMTCCSTTTCPSTARTSKRSPTASRPFRARPWRTSGASARIPMPCRSAPPSFPRTASPPSRPRTRLSPRRTCATKGDVSLAAICSREAAERYGLSILAEGINDMKHNETRFIAVSRTPTCLPEDNRIEIAFHIPNAAGTLITVLDIIAHYGIDMTEIHSRPLKDSPWCYVFYVDFTGNISDHAVRSLLYQLHEELPYIKVLGSYKVD